MASIKRSRSEGVMASSRIDVHLTRIPEDSPLPEQSRAYQLVASFPALISTRTHPWRVCRTMLPNRRPAAPARAALILLVTALLAAPGTLPSNARASEDPVNRALRHIFPHPTGRNGCEELVV